MSKDAWRALRILDLRQLLGGCDPGILQVMQRDRPERGLRAIVPDFVDRIVRQRDQFPARLFQRLLQPLDRVRRVEPGIVADAGAGEGPSPRLKALVIELVSSGFGSGLTFI